MRRERIDHDLRQRNPAHRRRRLRWRQERCHGQGWSRAADPGAPYGVEVDPIDG